jgi:hypothetical protein
MIEGIVPGGQTGADLGALRAARAAGIATGGWAPKGWLVESDDGRRDVPAPWLAEYGLVECPEPGYAARRRRNVHDADAALLFGDVTSAGSRGLIRDCRELGKAWVHVQSGTVTPREVIAWLGETPHVRVLMVAGNRESKAPGIGGRVERFLEVVFHRLARG